MMEINWDWYLKEACFLFEADDKQFEVNLEGLKYNAGNKYIELEKDSPDYLFAKYRYRIISIAYVKVALILANKDNSIDEDADESYESEYESSISITEMILWIIGGLLLGVFVLAPVLEYLLF